jgi:Domain of unknown function (DUF4505)
MQQRRHPKTEDESTSTSTITATTTANTASMTPARLILASQPQQHQPRCYFYNIDLHGRLYLEENRVKNITTSIKDMKVLDSFFAQIKYINEIHKEYMIQQNIPIQDYPFISICQREWNLIRPAATPIVFHALVDHEQFLLYGSSNTSILREPFDETNGIVVSKKSGMLYHKLTTHSYYPLSARRQRQHPMTSQQLLQPQQRQQYALIRSTVALTLSDRIVDLHDATDSPLNDCHDDRLQRSNGTSSLSNQTLQDLLLSTPRNATASKHVDNSNTLSTTSRTLLTHPPSSSSLNSGLGFITKYNRIVPILYLPSYAEPGPYSMLPSTQQS